jgi:methyltransferase family protein
MSEPGGSERQSSYSRHWDNYVDADWDIVQSRTDGELEWPGDEWGNPEAWEHIFKTLFVQHGEVDSWQRAVEVGQGSGKYTVKVLRNPEVSVRAYDVSASFLEVCTERCREEVEAGRLSPRLLDVGSPGFLLDDLRDWRRNVDAFYSIDAMVHVDLQYLMAYLVTAAAVLREGGKLILTMTTTSTDEGFQRLLSDIKVYWGSQAEPGGSGKLEWVNGKMLEELLPRLGFEIDFLREPTGIYTLLVASLVRPEMGDELAQYVAP